MIDLSMPLAATRLALAALLGAGAVHKCRDLASLCSAMSSYRRDPPSKGTQFVTTLALAIATAEAAAMIAGSWTLLHTVYGVILGVLLFLLHAGAILLNIARGNRLADCGCAFCD